MRRATVLLLWLALSLATPLLAQEQEESVLRRVEARVTAVVGPVVHIDRGRSSSIEPGDRALFYPIGGETREGEVRVVEDRAGQVELRGTGEPIEPGTRVEVLVPADRLAPQRGGDDEVESEHPPWTSQEGPWDPEAPLLAKVKVPGPADRDPHWFGRWYTMAEWTDDGQGDRSYLFAREGVDLRYENPFDRGGSLHFDGEFNVRRADVPDEQDEDETHVRVDRLSYAFGGTRDEARRVEVGRFLHSEFPELGVLDGIETVKRLPNGDRWGASAGFLPQPDETLDTGQDFQTAVFYRHVRGEREQLSIGTGFQKTWHEGKEDRDLLLGNLRWYPGTNWSAWASAWVDLYRSEDVAKGSGPELTLLTTGLGRRFGTTGGVNVTFSRFRFPELLRQEYSPVTFAELADDRTDRLSLSGWRQLSEATRLYARVDRWKDEESSGNGGEVRFDVKDLLFDRSRWSTAVFAQDGKFSDVAGLRTSVTGYTSRGNWDVAWVLGEHENVGFLGAQSNLDQHRVRARWDVRTGGGWDLSLYTEQRFGDEQDALTIGFYLQRGF